MAFPDTLSNLRLYIDSKQNENYVTRFVDPDTFIESMPPLGNATLTPEQLTEANQPILENNLIDFRDPEVTHFDLSSGSFDFGGVTGALTPVFTVSFKVFYVDSGNQMVLVNHGGGDNFEVGDINKTFVLRVRGKAALLSDGTTSLTSQEAFILDDWNYVTFRIDVANETGDLIINGTEYNDLVLDGTGTAPESIRIGSRGSSVDWQGEMEYMVGAQSFATLDQLRDLDLFIRDELVEWPPYLINGDPQAGIVVEYTAYDDRDKTNPNLLERVVTDAQGNAPLSVSVPTGKHLAAHATYVDSGTGDTYADIERWIEDYPET